MNEMKVQLEAAGARFVVVSGNLLGGALEWGGRPTAEIAGIVVLRLDYVRRDAVTMVLKECNRDVR